MPAIWIPSSNCFPISVSQTLKCKLILIPFFICLYVFSFARIYFTKFSTRFILLSWQIQKVPLKWQKAFKSRRKWPENVSCDIDVIFQCRSYSSCEEFAKRLNTTYARTVMVTESPRFCARKIKKASELFPIAKTILINKNTL